MDTFELISTRRSIRKFTDDPVSDDLIHKILEAGIRAPSGLNNQPWRFAVIRDSELKSEISVLTHYSKIVLGANVLIAVFLDNSASYDRTKDCQAVGACIQNMLLSIHHLGLGAVWLGEILKNRETVERILEVPEGCELMAVIALGHPLEEKKAHGSRKPIEEVVIGRK